ncbi:uncharacterized protein [Argopecten irradians]|uniref:uncharacterized protein n=1 Tax=Argopecten irradians TaxID=31199 RepID=UPI00371D2C16
MAGRMGKIDNFDDSVESWKCYQERLKQFFKANEVPNGKKVPVLLSVIGGKPYSILHDLVAPDLPGDKSYVDLVGVLNGHFNPQPLQIAERFRFHKRDQKSGESIREFNAAIRKLSEHCGFGQSLDETLRDRLVCGLRNDNIQKKLLSEDNLTYKNALDIAIAMETASRDAVELQREKSGNMVNKINKVNPKKKMKKKTQQSGLKNEKKSQKPCFRCNGKNHSAEECFYKDYSCNACKEKGHIQRACRNTEKEV